MNNNLKPIQTIQPFKRFCMTIGELPTSYLESMSYYEMLLWFTKFLQETVIPTVNNNAEAVNELQTKYIELKNYIDNYFDNLDVQEEINNKLDEMADSGQLTDIIAQYLGLAGMITFNTVAEMQAATNLVNGSKCATLGYTSVNDGGNAFYKVRTVTNDDVVDDMFIVELDDDNLVAELIINLPLKPEQLGAKGDGITDDTTIIQNAINHVNDILMEKQYKVTELVINKSNFKLNFNKILGSIKINADKLLQFIDIKGNNLVNESGIGLNLVSHTDYGIQYCRFSIELIRADKCIKLNASDGGWINSNYFYKTNVSYHTGIETEELTGTTTYNGNIISEFGFEDITQWFYIKNASHMLFEKCRMIPFEADGQGTAIRELGILKDTTNVTFNNDNNGTYYEFITFNNSRGVVIKARPIKYDGTKEGDHMRITSNGEIQSIIYDSPIYKKSISTISSPQNIETYQWDITKPIILNYDTSKYMFINIKISDNIANALKYVDIQIIGTTANSLDIARNNNVIGTLPSGTTAGTYRFFY